MKPALSVEHGRERRSWHSLRPWYLLYPHFLKAACKIGYLLFLGTRVVQYQLHPMTWLESAANLLTTGALLTWGAVDLYSRWQQRSQEQVTKPMLHQQGRHRNGGKPSGVSLS